MSKKTLLKFLCMVLASFFGLLLYSVSNAETPRMSKEELKSQLDNENVIFVEVGPGRALCSFVNANKNYFKLKKGWL